MNGLAMSSNRLTQARIKEREKTNACITANIAQAVVAPSNFRVAMATMGPVLASAFCVAAIMYPLGSLLLRRHSTVATTAVELNVDVNLLALQILSEAYRWLPLVTD
jgi:hypothetical protein